MGVLGIALLLAALTLLVMYPQTWRQLARPLLQPWQAPATTDELAAAGDGGGDDHGTEAPAQVPAPAADVPADDDATTPKAAPASGPAVGAVPTLSLAAAAADDDDDDDDDADTMPPPLFPAAQSAQRARAPPAPGLMAPPPPPPPRAVRMASLPVPHRGPPRPLPVRAPAAATPALLPPPSTAAMPARRSRKVVLAPGHSPLDWARIAADPAGHRLRGNLPPDAPDLLRVTPSQLKRHNGRRGQDAWTALGGMVYNITPYLPFHPGGEVELRRCAGKDGSRLFNEVHAWVNYDNMLAACRIGVLVDEHAPTTSPMEEMD